MTDILVGGLVGIASALITTIVQYRISRRSGGSEDGGLPGCMVLVIVGLGAAGLLMLAASLLLTGEILLAVRAGIGVGAGFFLGFSLMLTLWWLWSTRRQRPWL